MLSETPRRVRSVRSSEFSLPCSHSLTLEVRGGRGQPGCISAIKRKARGRSGNTAQPPEGSGWRTQPAYSGKHSDALSAGRASVIRNGAVVWIIGSLK